MARCITREHRFYYLTERQPPLLNHLCVPIKSCQAEHRSDRNQSQFAWLRLLSVINGVMQRNTQPLTDPL